ESLSLFGNGTDGGGALQGVSGTWKGTVSLDADTSIGVPDFNGRFTVSGRVTGKFGLTKFGPGTLQFSGAVANDYQGRTLVSAGTLELNKTAGVAVPHQLDIGNASGGSDPVVVQLLRDDQIAHAAPVNIRKSGELLMSSFTASFTATI